MNGLNKNNEDENKDESTIINEDNFEIYNSKNEKEINDNTTNKEKNEQKTSYNSDNFNKIVIKDAKDEEQLRFDFLKEYTKYGNNQNNNFLKRMNNDIDKRRNMEKLMNKFIEQTKFKMKEPEKIKVFNRLIEDTNRRYESKEKIIKYQEEKEFDLEDNKKYNQKQWDEIYKHRFGRYLTNFNSMKIKSISDILQKELDKNKKEKQSQINKNKNKKRNKTEIKQMIENNINNLYNDYLLRKQRKINRENNNNKLIVQKNELIRSNKLNKSKKNIQSQENIKNLKLNLKTNKPYGKTIESNNRKINYFTPKSLKTRNIFMKPSIEDEMKKINNNLDGEKISDILINIFFKKNGI